jgi:glycerol-3-phosphate dehydrogenase (NAD(P)+)
MLATRKHEVTLWDYFPETVETIRQTGRNERYLPGIELPAGLQGGG